MSNSSIFVMCQIISILKFPSAMIYSIISYFNDFCKNTSLSAWPTEIIPFMLSRNSPIDVLCTNFLINNVMEKFSSYWWCMASLFISLLWWCNALCRSASSNRKSQWVIAQCCSTWRQLHQSSGKCLQGSRPAHTSHTKVCRFWCLRSSNWRFKISNGSIFWIYFKKRIYGLSSGFDNPMSWFYTISILCQYNRSLNPNLKNHERLLLSLFNSCCNFPCEIILTSFPEMFTKITKLNRY